MTLDECIAYLEHVSSERKARSKKARQILKYLQELKELKEIIVDEPDDNYRTLEDYGFKRNIGDCPADEVLKLMERGYAK